MATSDVLGAISIRISSRFALNSVANNEMPVAFPPGWARLGTTPAPTGSPTNRKIIGVVLVAFRAAIATGVVYATSASRFSPASSAASSGSRSSLFSAKRRSKATFFPSIHPNARKASGKTVTVVPSMGAPALKIPIV